ncbi:hypothetical protein BU23DRAFT_554962 [Bimuria novae-zelandiae CBS 107.79]|uniref:Uncharacterized protein n=1 Tax=Bimuria novae-zelandiae CBS 107.79 TaxID=1447943 RepID=A0A6A5V7H1_9PLEO|nr:hypothetical protein BU23DRAFT_554962 [Bimuria novae-zelandiae CBS 107.79]
MADVRSMLKQQRAARQQAKAPKQSASSSKKRKAADDTPEERKRTKTEERNGVPAGFFDEGVAQEAGATPPDTATAPPAAQMDGTIQLPDTKKPPLPAAADAELDAFMAEMEKTAAVTERNPHQRNVPLYSGAVIESAPMTAAQLAAQAREEQNAQRARRDEEMEGEKEDAARALEDEFEEMDGLEERVKKLREQREALRAKHTAVEVRDQDTSLPTAPADDEDSELGDEDWDDWRFRPA